MLTLTLTLTLILTLTLTLIRHPSQLQLGSYSDVLMPWCDGASGP